jgi:hypothetical protein
VASIIDVAHGALPITTISLIGVKSRPLGLPGSVVATMVTRTHAATTGGNVIDGMYFKSQDVVYTGAGGSAGATGYTVRESLVISSSSTGTALLTSVFADSNGTTTERLTLSPTTGTGATTLTFVCPAFGPSITFYNVRIGDVGQDLLDIYILTDRIETFTRQ